MKVDLKGIDEKTVEKVGEEGYFTREKKHDKKGEEAFFKQGEKPEVRTVAAAKIRLAWHDRGLKILANSEISAEEESH